MRRSEVIGIKRFYKSTTMGFNLDVASNAHCSMVSRFDLCECCVRACVVCVRVHSWGEISRGKQDHWARLAGCCTAAMPKRITAPRKTS